MKKKIIISLSILLPLLLLGYCGKCYADNYKDWTVADLKNCFYNIGIYKGIAENTVIQNIETLNNDIENIVIALNYNKNVFISCGRGNDKTVYILVNNEETIIPYWYNNTITNWGTASNKSTRYQVNIANRSLTYTNAIDTSYGLDYTNMVYTTNNIYNSKSGTTIVTNRGYIPNNLFEGYYQNIVWKFEPNGNTITINGGNQWQYRAINGGWSISLGSLTDSEWCEKIEYRVAYYYKNLNKYGDYGNKTTLYDYNKNGPLYRYWTSTNNNGTYTTPIRLDTYKYQNCLIQLIITSEIPNELTTLYYDFLITNDKTYIAGGEFYPTITFSGDYVNEYNNQIQENKEQENNDFWKEVYDDLFTMNSGDIQELLDNFIENVDLEEYGDIQIEQDILQVLEGEPTDFVISWGAVYTPYIANIGTQRQKIIESGEINFSQMARQNQGLNSVVEIARIICTFTIIILLLKNIWFTLMRVLGVGTAMYEDQQEEASRLEAVSGETININGETGEYTRTLTYYDPRTNYRQNIHYNPNRRRKK